MPAPERGFMIGNSAAMRTIYRIIKRVAPPPITVLVTGESGTGKEYVAQHIHGYSRRAEGPFITANCGAVPESLFESQMFGHVKGAFTGASANQTGLFEHARGGTLFLDEVGDLSPSSQVKLLRVLQDSIIRPVGSTKEVKVDVRVVAATNRNLEQMVRRGTFREDLYYRLNGVRISVPPLREHKEDIPALAHHFIKTAISNLGLTPHTITPEGISALVAYDWPGNIRQLEHTITRSIIFADDPAIDAAVVEDALKHSGVQYNRVPEHAPPSFSSKLSPEAAREMITFLEEVIRQHADKKPVAQA